MKNFSISVDYWEKYYSSAQKPNIKSIPSQFSIFVLNEYFKKEYYFDIGCGNGRDAICFAQHGKNVIGLDCSKAAISNDIYDAKTYKSLKYEIVDFRYKNELMKFIDHYKDELHDSVIYSRFFLHAINSESEDNFVYFCENALGPDGVVCVEFRTLNDEKKEKMTAHHFRRFIDPIKIEKKFLNSGFENIYNVEGTGYAKYGKDDAYVARMVFRKK
jgi:2-polyprenyl-3-methyl-5-hydroxy-6-metoxy-1,4-benzoquinol methylase